MAFNVQYSFNNGDITGTATNSDTLINEIYYNSSSITQITLSGTAEGDISWLVNGCPSLTSLDLSNLDTSNATKMEGMFYGCSALTSLDLSSFNTSNVTIMDNMFAECRALTSLNLSNFDTSNATQMQYMFNNCYNLTSIDLSSFDTSNVTRMENMFDGCSALEHIFVSNTFVTAQATSFNNMFYNCTSLPNFDSTKIDKTMAKQTWQGGYLEGISIYKIQQYIKIDGQVYNAYPKVAVDGTTIVDNNGVISATAQEPDIATTTTAGIVKPDGTTITIDENGVISSVGGSDISLVVKGVM